MLKIKKGFSLIQVLAIIVILGIISSVILVNMNRNVAQSQFAMKVNQADILYEAVSKFYLENGYFPIEDPNADYLEKPVLVDLSLVAPKLKEELKGYYYLYGDKNMVFYDYPEDYISRVIGNYETIPVIDNSNYIDMNELKEDNYLIKTPQTSYFVSSNGEIKQTFEDNISDNISDKDIGSIKDKPTTPTIIPNKVAPYFSTDTITFTATSLYAKGIKTYEWTGISGSNKYAVGTITITAVAVGNDNVKSDKSTFTMIVNKENLAPSKPVISISPNGNTFTSNDKVVITATSTDPEGERITYKWVGLEGTANTGTDKFTPNLSRGTHTLSVYAIDASGNRSEKTTITLKIANGKPTVISATHNPKPSYYNNTVEILASAVDPDGDTITYTYEGVNKNKKYPRGTHKITIYAVDTFGAKSDPFVYDLVIHNRAPYPPKEEQEIDSPSGKHKWTEEEKLKYLKITMSPYDKTQKVYSYTPITFTATSYDHNGNITTVDMDNDQLFYNWNLGTTKTVIQSIEGENQFKATYMPGNHTIKVRVYDNMHEYSDWVSFSFYITNTPPTKPTITKSHTNPLYADVDITWSIGGSTDIDGHSITYHWKETPLTRYVKGSHTVYGRAQDSFGDYSEWASLTFQVVNKPPTSPTITRTPSGTSIYANTDLSFVAKSTDVDGVDAISYEWENKFTRYVKGTHTVKARAKDSDGAYSDWVSHTFTILNTAPTTPVITMSPSSNLYYNTDISFVATASDIDVADSLSYEWINKATRYMPGTHTVQARAKDTDGAYSPYGSITFNVINIAPSKPTISKTHATPLYADTPISFSMSGSTDPEGHAITYHWQTTPSAKYVRGTHTVYGRAKDSFGDYSDWASLTFTVVNKPPTTPVPATSTSLPNYNQNVSFAFYIKTSSTDVDGDSLTYTWNLNGGAFGSQTAVNKSYATGTHTIGVRAYDGADFSATGTYTIRWSAPYYYDVLIQSGYYYDVLIASGYWTSVLSSAAWTETVYTTVTKTKTESYTYYVDEPWCFSIGSDGRVWSHSPPCDYSSNATTISVARTGTRTVSYNETVTSYVNHPAVYRDVYVPPVYEQRWSPPVYETRYAAGYWY